MIGSLRFGSVAGKGVGASEAEVGEGVERVIDDDATVIEKLLKFAGGRIAVTGLSRREQLPPESAGLRSH